MNDTPPEMARKYRAMLLQRSGAERLKMASSMFATSRTLIVASLREKDPSASPATIRRALFLRFYGADFDAQTREKILVRITQEAEAAHGGRQP